MTVITLTTDFGTADGYVGIMKGVILGIAPDATLVDISHEIPPQDIRAGAFILKTARPYFPSGTIHLAIVDPGVGSHRRILAIRTQHAVFVGPDNGILSWASEEDDIREVTHITDSQYWLQNISHTFHGRDIFAPVAAHLARGVPQQCMGNPISNFVRVPRPLPQLEGDSVIHSEIIYIDQFGNLVTGIRIRPGDHCITNLAGQQGERHIGPEASIEIQGHRIDSIADTYANANPGELVALTGSSGHLEVAVRNGNAANALDGYVGAPVRIVLHRKSQDKSLS